MSIFSQWLNEKAVEYGGVDGLRQRIPQVEVNSLARWLSGLSNPTYQAQWWIAQATGIEFRSLREMMELPHTYFAEVLTARILAKGRFNAFCGQCDIKKTTLDAWLGSGSLPATYRYGADCPVVSQIVAALVKWDPDLDARVLKAEFALALAKDLKRRQDAKAGLAAHLDCSKKSVDCNLAKIA